MIWNSKLSTMSSNLFIDPPIFGDSKFTGNPDQPAIMIQKWLLYSKSSRYLVIQNKVCSLKFLLILKFYIVLSKTWFSTQNYMWPNYIKIQKSIIKGLTSNPKKTIGSVLWPSFGGTSSMASFSHMFVTKLFSKLNLRHVRTSKTINTHEVFLTSVLGTFRKMIMSSTNYKCKTKTHC